VDEPEIYLHPDIQRQLLNILRLSGPDIIIATHSTEIISEADPSDILLIDKTKKSAPRLREINEVQSVLELIGSVQNITLTQLARTRKVLFVEGTYDFVLLRKFATRLGFRELGAGVDLTPVESEGASTWERIQNVAWGIGKTLGSELCIGAIFDRDYRCEEEINSIYAELKKHLVFVYFHACKEIENYFLVPVVLDRALTRALLERAKRTGEDPPIAESISILLEEITDSLKNDAQGQYLSKWSSFHKTSRKDPATLATEAIGWFEKRWRDLTTRLEIVPGKRVLRLLRDATQVRYGVNLTDQKIVDAFHLEEVPQGIKDLVDKLDEYRRSGSQMGKV
jgi:hypothetical protein